ncbi:MAG: deoxyribodipyrimidine photo-lyase [Polyangiaceae bacterium]
MSPRRSSSDEPVFVVWFRGKDLRLGDHPALTAALAGGARVVPIFVVDPYFFAPERARRLAHRMQFLLGSIEVLAREIAERGSRLVLLEGKSHEVIPAAATALRAVKVFAMRAVEPVFRERDRRVREALGDRFELLEGETLTPPGSVLTGSGGPYLVFTPFSRAVRDKLPPAELARSVTPAPRSLPPLPAQLGLSEVPLPSLAKLGITANPRLPEPGEIAARARLSRFVAAGLAGYAELRDRMDLDGTSHLSQDLKFGTLSVREVVAAALTAASPPSIADKFVSEVLWREFTHHTLFHRPTVLREPFRAEFRGFPWVFDQARWAAWVSGNTGLPVIDAAARQLLAEGWVHNRARMITASFLTRQLLVPYTHGEAHYLEHLVDGDWAQNNAGWQWCAGSGTDAQPYFRVFNPVLQAERYDPTGAYVRRWVPELAGVSAERIHKPWLAPRAERGSYPTPIVDLAEARDRYLAVAKLHMKNVRGASGSG